VENLALSMVHTIVLIMLATSNVKFKATVWHPYACPCRQHTHRDSPGGSMWCRHHALRPDNKEDRHTGLVVECESLFLQPLYRFSLGLRRGFTPTTSSSIHFSLHKWAVNNAAIYIKLTDMTLFPSMFRHCCMGGRNGIQPVKSTKIILKQSFW